MPPAVHVVVANSEAFQPPKEWNAIGTGIGRDADHADLDLVGELAGGVAVAVKIAVPLPELVFVDHPRRGGVCPARRANGEEPARNPSSL